MRMWMVETRLLCRKHLLGEHYEIHKLVGHLGKGKSVLGWVKGNCLELRSIQSRHDALVEEMTRRGFLHKSPLLPVRLERVPLHLTSVKVNVGESLRDLVGRCPDCRARGLREGEG